MTAILEWRLGEHLAHQAWIIMIAWQAEHWWAEHAEFASDPRITIRIVMNEVAGGEDRIELMKAAATATGEIESCAESLECSDSAYAACRITNEVGVGQLQQLYGSHGVHANAMTADVSAQTQ